jgi:hypothetical protein
MIAVRILAAATLLIRLVAPTVATWGSPCSNRLSVKTDANRRKTL